jgi:hypothetical protein
MFPNEILIEINEIRRDIDRTNSHMQATTLDFSTIPFRVEKLGAGAGAAPRQWTEFHMQINSLI